jgi:hypothetical protein
MASYLDHKPSDIEIIEALRYHYRLNVQRVMLNIEIKTIGEALDLLRRIELMETRESHNKEQRVQHMYVITAELNQQPLQEVEIRSMHK